MSANKVMAAGRRELRDIVATVTVHETVLPLGAVVWAAVDKAPGFTPEGLIAEVRRNSNYHKTEWLRLESSEPIDPDLTARKLSAALDEAEAFVVQMPTEKVGLLFLEDGKVIQPDPARLNKYQPTQPNDAVTGPAASRSNPACSNATPRVRRSGSGSHTYPRTLRSSPDPSAQARA